jgi:hypothetical protein
LRLFRDFRVGALLPFIQDADFRESIRLDISAAGDALAGSHWKGATVLAGAAVEALLLWAIQQIDPGRVADAARVCIAAGSFSQSPGTPPERWTFSDYIAIARELALITPNTATQANLAKDRRNLIHPGRAQRLGQPCDRATALVALAAVEFVARDLTRHFNVPHGQGA